jgi:two-component system response regulator QseB
MRILLVEDDKNLGKATAEGLRKNYAVDWVENAEDAALALDTTNYMLVILDIGLPGISGFDFLRNIRKQENQIPVIFLTARDAVHHRIEGLNIGADDYLVKPFDLYELLARCAALIRREQKQALPEIRHKGIIYDKIHGHIQKNGKTIILSNKERAVFDCLITNIGRPVSKDKIMENIYDWSSEEIESNTIEVHVSSLRRKLGQSFIKTIREVGYLIEK